MGLCLAPGKGPARLHQFLSLCRPRGRVRCVPRIGWHGRRFILPDAVFGFEAGESVILQAERVDNPFKHQGTLGEWQEYVGRFCVGNSRLLLSVATAMAAPLLYLAGAESGGLHLVGGSSLGKTTALVVAGSVCGGGGVRGYILQWRATANGLEGVAAAHCDALLCLDELSQVTPQAAGETAYMGRLKQWATSYERQPIKDEDDLFDRMQNLLAFIRLGMIDYIFTESDVPPELKATQGVILDTMDYLPGRLARAFALDRYYPEVAASIPDTFTMTSSSTSSKIVFPGLILIF